MPSVRIPPTQRFVLEDVSWGFSLLREFDRDRRHLRVTYDQGVLEITTLSHEPEFSTSFLGRLVVVMNAEGKYEASPTSTLFPLPISPADLLPFIQMRSTRDDNAVIKQFRLWLRERIAAGQ